MAIDSIVIMLTTLNALISWLLCLSQYIVDVLNTHSSNIRIIKVPVHIHDI